MSFKLKSTSIADLLLVETDKFTDERGYFMESYKKSALEKAGLRVDFQQDNFSYSTRNVLRGLHYQLPPYAQGKLVRVLEGVIWDVAVDIRPGSPTFKRWYGAELSESNAVAFYIPEGFAHGFVVLSDEAKVLYKTTAEYNKDAERGIIWNDPELDIFWPVKEPIVSSKDRANLSLSEAELFN